MEQYVLKATIQRKNEQDHLVLREEEIDILFVKDVHRAEIHCIDKNGERSDERISDQYSWDGAGIILKQLELAMPNTRRIRSIGGFTKTYIITLIKQGLKEIKDSIIEECKEVPEISKDLDNLNPSIIMYADIEPVKDPKDLFYGRLVKVSKYEKGPIMFEFERMTLQTAITYNYKMSTFEGFVRAINIIEGATGAIGIYKFAIDRGSQSKAIRLIKTAVGIEDKLPWHPIPTKTNRDCKTILTSERRSGVARTTPGGCHGWGELSGYTGHHETRKKEFFFKELLGIER